ncbi:MAG: hypothetical protein GXP38_00770, partial [Chloroflexi bacterium]|nr:hypothetical protein [Chloroflexota bacterium]
MDKPIVACIQHRLIVPKTPDEFDAYLHRFLRTAQAKGASLALFPELSGLATAIPSFSGWRNSLLKTAGQTHKRKRGFWQRTKSKLASSAANVVKADLHKSLLQYLQEMPESLHDAYYSAFSSLARHYDMTIVAGSMYEWDATSGAIRNVSLVFGPDGSLLGKQAKVVLAPRDREMAQAAEGWGVIPTPVGNLGILLGNDVLYPEPARILAYQGADMLLVVGAVTKPATYHKIRQAALARCQENQLYGMVSFLVGPDPFAGADAPPFVGKSAIFAPLEFTPRFSGVMVEVGSPIAEGVITAEWDYPALHELWEQSETPLRREMPLLQAGAILASVYSRALPLAEAEPLMLGAGTEEPTEPEIEAETEAEVETEAPVSAVAEAEPSETIDLARKAEVEPLLEGKEILMEEHSILSRLTPILPPVPTPLQDEMDEVVDALEGRMEIHARNVDAAAEEVRVSIAAASEHVRAVVVESPEQVEVEIQQAVAGARQVLDEAPITLESPSSEATEPEIEPESEEVGAEGSEIAPEPTAEVEAAPEVKLETEPEPAEEVSADATEPVPETTVEVEETPESEPEAG